MPPPPLQPHLISHWLDQEVTSCVEAAALRGVPLEHELKTLVLRAGEGYWAVHVRGDHEVSLRAVKRHLGRREAYLVSPEILEEMGLAPGTVCPFLPPIWDMPQLVSREVLSLEYVTTNNGTLNGFFRVDPRLLLRAPRIQAGDFEGRLSTEVALDEG